VQGLRIERSDMDRRIERKMTLVDDLVVGSEGNVQSPKIYTFRVR
jgi:hypothetical protein